ncbi:SMP-30/gluconolactonase/LRE family protein [Nocardia brasiliensis]|uniref:SMP-30/gluconolactonase/LRE family protein n=1 Tax=Nocardia brasiliensis TaxID=37326 RepID=UPI00189342F2|nr:SMP-30/gluconolactonase/LRE family protein [Nocardia brasiliensis]MBF6124473.1 SMP-30/gluconolactonase/LRE family protein [Nocardia brasiliensis]
MAMRRVLVGSVLAVGVALTTVAGTGSVVAQDGSVEGCARWASSTVAAGYGILENLAFDGRGGMLLSEVPASGVGGALRRLGSDGSRTELAQASSPGGFVVSRDLGSPNTLTRIDADGVGARPFVTELTSTNGLAYDGIRRKLFVSTTFEPVTTLAAIDLAQPDAAPARITVPGFGPLNAADDLTVGPDGAVYLALNAAGRVLRIDPDSARTCVVADGIPFATSARFGAGPGWDPGALYVTSFTGAITRLTPP